MTPYHPAPPVHSVHSVPLVPLVLLVLCVALAGCASNPPQDIKPMPMFHLEAHDGQPLTISGLRSLQVYYPVNPDAYRDRAAEAWAGVAQAVASMGIMGLTQWGTVYSMGKTMQKIAPMFGSGNTQINQNSVGGQQDLRLLSPDSTTPQQVVRPEVVTGGE